MEKVNEYLDIIKEQSDKNKEITIGLAAIGAIYVTSNIFKKLSSFYKYFLRPSSDLKSRYGNGWAIVTGASDGIGKAYAFELAKRGFKVGLIARNQTKLEKVGSEITTTYGVETKSLVFDFDGLYTQEKVNELKDKLSTFDKVSLLINNVGVMYNKKLNELAEEHIHSLLSVNVIGLTLVTKILLPKLLENENKGGIINIGS